MIDPEEFDQDGYIVCRDVVDQNTLYNVIYYKDSWDHPVRGHDLDGRYYGEYHKSVEWGNYWTESLSDHVDVIEIEKSIQEQIAFLMRRPVFYHSDVSVLMPGSKSVRPHVDTPHRHEPWNMIIGERLGLQVAVPMQAYKEDSGTTAFLPNSHTKYWNIKQCYRGEYTQDFLSGCVQPKVDFGDMIVWDARTLHSQMMNTTSSPRYMLLFNYVEEDVLDSLAQYEADL